jgi:hypothetical protein
MEIRDRSSIDGIADPAGGQSSMSMQIQLFDVPQQDDDNAEQDLPDISAKARLVRKRARSD